MKNLRKFHKEKDEVKTHSNIRKSSGKLKMPNAAKTPREKEPTF